MSISVLPTRTTDGRFIHAVNAIPGGYTVYPTGEGSDIANGTYQGGEELKLDKDNTSKTFQYLDHYYGLGGIAVWQDCSVDDSVTSEIIAPATQGLLGTGDLDYILVDQGGGNNIIIPVTPGTGTHSLDLTATLNANVSILKCTPVPASGIGYFDYDPTTNVITADTSGGGAYNLFDFEITMLKPCYKCWGTKNGHTPLIASNVVGKQMFNFYKVKFSFNTTETDSRKVGVIVEAAVRVS